MFSLVKPATLRPSPHPSPAAGLGGVPPAPTSFTLSPSYSVFWSERSLPRLKISRSRNRRWRRNYRRSSSFSIAAASDDDFGSIPPLLDDSNGMAGGKTYIMSSSEGEDSDGEMMMDPPSDLELPSTKERRDTPEAALTVAAHRIATLRGGHRRKGIRPGVWLNLALTTFLAVFLLLVDWWSWRIVRLPLEPFYLMRPFCMSLVMAAFTGYLYIPIVRSMKIHQVLRTEGPNMHFSKRGTPTMGGLFFIPVGVFVAGAIAASSSIEVFAAGAVTFAFLAIGLLDDILSVMKKHNYGLPGWIKLMLQVAAGTCFSFWLYFTEISSRYSMKFLVPLPQPLGLVYLGKLYLILTAFCFVSMGNGVNLTDGLDGLAGGTSALAFVGMSVAVLPINPALSIFGASMAGACVGFLFHNGYKASVFMGDTGSLALGGALAAIAACTGMFFPLFICSGAFVLEVLSVIVQDHQARVWNRPPLVPHGPLPSSSGVLWIKRTIDRRKLLHSDISIESDCRIRGSDFSLTCEDALMQYMHYHTCLFEYNFSRDFLCVDISSSSNMAQLILRHHIKVSSNIFLSFLRFESYTPNYFSVGRDS